MVLTVLTSSPAPSPLTKDNQEAPEEASGIMPRPDKQYYFDLVVFKVGNTIFRVPKTGFIVPGTIFETMFSLPTVGENLEGLNDENPINLPVNEESFRGFLRAMYPFNGLEIETADWLSALELSTMWMFDGMRLRAIEALTPWVVNQDAKDIVLLAKKHRVLKWLKDGYIRLLRVPGLTLAHLCATPSLDWKTMAKLLSVKLLTSNTPSYYNAYGGPSVLLAFITSTMESEFKEEFSDMRDGYYNLPYEY